MRLVEQQQMISRYRQAGRDLYNHIRISDLLADREGLAYLNDHLVDDIAEELKLRDAFDDAMAELNAELLECDVIASGSGYYKINALGMPHFYAGVPVEVAR